ncbi:MAG TPA: tRNA dihydrouridine synthase DusB [Planctomycetota bacterium]|nr:tRNA dihydrouridine synthase DusB [Planctomycetota bacterium]
MLNSRGLRLQQRVLQSPMAGCTDLAYRRIARRFGCELAFCEMVKDRPVVEWNERTREMLATAAWDHPLGMQLLGRDPNLLAEAAKRLEGLGCDVIDLNLGCPVNKVVKDQCGSALLREPDQVARIFERLVPAVKIPVTMKMRTGFDEGDDERFLQVAQIADRSGVAAITAHGRTQKQLYRGFSNHEAIRKVKESVSIPVIGNGDIRCGADAVRMIEATGCDGVMLARGALGNPWIYREVQAALKENEAHQSGASPLSDSKGPARKASEASPSGPTIEERAAVLAEHFTYLRELYGDRHACLRVRRVVSWYVVGVVGGSDMRVRAFKVEEPAHVEAIVEDFAKSLPADKAEREAAEIADEAA